MNDPDPIERELQRFSPAPLPPSLRARLCQPDEPLTRADRILACFSAAGALAACFIVTVCTWQAINSEKPTLSPESQSARQKMAAEFQQMLASR